MATTDELRPGRATGPARGEFGPPPDTTDADERADALL
jgi:hypothetical protein